jgi:hypothetical protein
VSLDVIHDYLFINLICNLLSDSGKQYEHIFFFQNMHQGYPKETLVRFLKAREWNVSKAHKMVTFHTSFSTVGEVITGFNY